MDVPKKLFIRETCPREGWQNFPAFIPTETKIELIKRMLDSGAKDIELGIISSSPKLSRQFTDLETVSREILAYTDEKEVTVSVQVEDCETVRRALDLGLTHCHFFVSMSEAFSLAVSGESSEHSLVELEKALKLNAEIDVGFGAALACPYGERITDEHVLERIGRVKQLGVKSISLADTGGVATPSHVRHLLHRIGEEYALDDFCVHLHQTTGLGIANAFAALEEGVTQMDASLGAMGGCPFVKGAKGNIATEDLVNMALRMGIACDQDYEKTVEASIFQSRLLDTPVISSMATVYLAKQRSE